MASSSKNNDIALQTLTATRPESVVIQMETTVSVWVRLIWPNFKELEELRTFQLIVRSPMGLGAPNVNDMM